jgi:mannose-1-phosphate guanylyltransferase
MLLGSRHLDHIWALVLAGGDGVRLRPVVRDIVGDERPKQYAPLLGERSLLGQTLDRTSALIPSSRTLVVALERHAPYLALERLDPCATVLLQPDNRDTALGILYPAHWIARRDPEATLVVCPSDHFIGEPAAFMAHVADVVDFVEGHPSWLVLVGAHPTEPDAEYGWVEPGDELGRTDAGAICRAGRFREKPAPHVVARLFSQGWLWNTFVFVAKAASLIAAGQQFLPDLHERLVWMMAFAGTRREAWAVEQVYAGAPRSNFSVAVLQAGLSTLAVSELPPLLWSDVGTPRRLLRALQALRLSPSWMGRVLEASRLSAVR